VAEAAGREQIVTLAPPWAIAYAAHDGTELWRADCLNGEVTPSPILAAGHFIVVSPHDKMMGIRPDGQGDVTETHIAWSADDFIPDITSPVSDGELLFLAATPGQVTCFDAKDGKKLWEHDFEMDFNATPALVGNRLYLFTIKGVVLVLEAGRQFKELARFEMGEGVAASPAFAADRMFIRGFKNLYCIGPASGSGPLAKSVEGKQP